jgi:diaminobutyrate-2-oxoglutarate transaminase
MTPDIFDTAESNVRSYCRKFPPVFVSGSNAVICDEAGREYIDFLSGAGALNYGHDNPVIRDRIVEFLNGHGIVHSLDLRTPAKRRFIEKFLEIILQPRGYDYKLQFPGPTGTNAVEAALKLARKVTGRQQVVAFTNAYHGMTLGSLAVTARAWKRQSAGIALQNVLRMPFEGFLGPRVDSFDFMSKMICAPGSGIEMPAAIILETVQGEGGLVTASDRWLRRVAGFAKEHGILLIVDDVQAGCGRTGTFFSFEPAGIYPDIVCLSKSISGFGLPMALLLVRPEYDVWKPGEHNGTFRGNSLAFVAATEALAFWSDDVLRDAVARKADIVASHLGDIVRDFPDQAEARGRGLMQGVAWKDTRIAGLVSAQAFEMGVIAEVCGPDDDVIKVMPPLTIEDAVLEQGLRTLQSASEIVRRRTDSRHHYPLAMMELAAD